MSSASRQKLTVWWSIPCKSAIPMFRSMVEDLGREILFVALNDLPGHRKKLGWTMPDCGAMPVEVLGDDWRAQIDTLMEQRGGLHIVNGIYHSDRIKYCARRLAERDKRFGVIMEAPSNLEVGKKRFVKSLVAPIVTPMRTRQVARKAAFVMSASGSKPDEFAALGFARDRIHPFGYFPDIEYLDRPQAKDDTLRLLCIGMLSPFKGQDVLLHALAELKQAGVEFSCEITGYGTAEASLKALNEELGLTDNVNFAGVVSWEVLVDLFRTSSALVAPGFEEPWGIRINEGLLSGMPVIVSDGIGAKELVETSGAGEVFAAGDAGSLAQALIRLNTRLRDHEHDGKTENGSTDGAAKLRDLIKDYRPLITPASAGRFIAHVVDHVGSSISGETAAEGQLTPPWLDPNWRDLNNLKEGEGRNADHTNRRLG